MEDIMAVLFFVWRTHWKSQFSMAKIKKRQAYRDKDHLKLDKTYFV